MKWLKFLFPSLILVLVTSCSSNTANPANSTSLLMNFTQTVEKLPKTPESTIQISPTSPPKVYTVDEAMIYQQDFESETIKGITVWGGTWNVIADNTGNHSYCNSVAVDGGVFSFGNYLWTDYAVEFLGKALEYNEASDLVVEARYDTISAAPWAAINIQDGSADIHAPNQGYSHGEFQVKRDGWYSIRLEVYGNKVKLFVDNELLGFWGNTGFTHGMARLYAPQNSIMCFDDIRVWSLSSDGQIFPAPAVSLPVLEVVTDNAATGDGGNSWGGHQTRIVRTKDGVFTVYSIQGSGYFNRKWQLAWRQEDGTWPVIAQGDGGKDPANLLAAPDGTLYIVSWPGGIGTIWSGKPESGKIEMKEDKIPGLLQTNWPYSSAGIDIEGNFCILASQGGESKGGSFFWSCYLPSRNEWIPKVFELDYRYAYTYVFPEHDGQLSIVSTRDVRWNSLGYQQPSGAFDYVFDAIGFWHTEDISLNPLQQVFLLAEKQTEDFPFIHLNAQEDAYLDTNGNMHILYIVKGKSTKGEYENHHIIVSPDGKVIADVIIPPEVGDFCRIFQDTKEQFYILGSHGWLYPAGENGVTLGNPIQILEDINMVEYSGYYITVPRTGSALSDTFDVVFPSNKGTNWIYFQFTVPEE